MRKKAAGTGRQRRNRNAAKPRRGTRDGVAFPRPFTVRRSRVQGRGGFALRWIARGERIVEYVGERIPPAVADARYDDEAGRRHHTFLFSVDKKTVIDAAVDGNEARFINHSCDPNCEAVDRRGRIFIEAIRDIAPGEELAYDYNFELDEAITPALLRRYPCRCGAEGCRGTILVLKGAEARRLKAKLAKAKRRRASVAQPEPGVRPSKRPRRKRSPKTAKQAT